jgi:hypothetical protein
MPWSDNCSTARMTGATDVSFLRYRQATLGSSSSKFSALPGRDGALQVAIAESLTVVRRLNHVQPC